MNKIFTILILLTVNIECISIAQTQSVNLSILTKQLLSPVGSPERIAAANTLETQWSAVKKQANYDHNNKKQKRTDMFITNTIKYLKSKNSCKDSEKFTLYRGISGQAVISPKADSPGVHYTLPIKSIMRTAYTKSIGNFPRSQRGQALYRSLSKVNYELKHYDQKVSKEYTDLISKLALFDDKRPSYKEQIRTLGKGKDGGFAFIMGHNRTREDENSGEITNINLDYNELSSDQTTGHPADGVSGSPYSPFISTSLSEDSAYKFGGRRLILRVCPERLLPTSYATNPHEQEVFIPLFILPEEISEIRPKKLAPAVGAKDSELKQCFKSLESPTYFNAHIIESVDRINSQTSTLEGFRKKFMELCDFEK